MRMISLIFILIGSLFVGVVVVYVNNSGKIVYEYVRETEAAKHYKDRVDEQRGALKEMHMIADSSINVSQRFERRFDSAKSVIVTQDKTIKNLLNEKKVLLDSLRVRRYRSGRLEPVH
jgi:hypothetical protein